MLVDTSVWIDFFNGYASPEVNRLSQALAEGEPIALIGVVLAEILAGLKNDAEAERIADLLEAFEVVPEFRPQDYIEAARIYRHCRAKGLTIRSMIDCLIAQACLRDQRPLLSKDRDFSAIAECFPLSRITLG